MKTWGEGPCSKPEYSMKLNNSRDKKVLFSTSLPKVLREGIRVATDTLHRNKSIWIRTAIDLFLAQTEKDQEAIIMDSYRKIDPSSLGPFTTNLKEDQVIRINALAGSIHRAKTDILRAAIYELLSKKIEDQEREIKGHLSK